MVGYKENYPAIARKPDRKLMYPKTGVSYIQRKVTLNLNLGKLNIVSKNISVLFIQNTSSLYCGETSYYV